MLNPDFLVKFRISPTSLLHHIYLSIINRSPQASQVPTAPPLLCSRSSARTSHHCKAAVQSRCYTQQWVGTNQKPTNVELWVYEQQDCKSFEVDLVGLSPGKEDGEPRGWLHSQLLGSLPSAPSAKVWFPLRARWLLFPN